MFSNHTGNRLDNTHTYIHTQKQGSTNITANLNQKTTPKKNTCPLTKFNLCVLCKQNILSFDVSVDDFMCMEVRQTLRRRETMFFSCVNYIITYKGQVCDVCVYLTLSISLQI